MFRRRPDLSWPLILMLMGLFVLSLRLPRSWEQIARDSRLALRPRTVALTAAQTECQPIASPAAAVETIDLAESRAAPPAPAVANKVEVAASEVPPAPAVVVPVATPTLPEPDVTPVSDERPKTVEVTVTENKNETIPSEAATVTQPTFPTPLAPEPALAAVVPEPALTPDPTPSRAIVPEPQAIATAAVRQPSSEPVLSQPQPLATEENAAPELKAESAAQAAPAAAPSVSKVESRPMKAIGRAWEEPNYLLAQLEKLKKYASVQAWANETIGEIRRLGPAIAVGAPQTAEVLRRLDSLARQGLERAAKLDDEAAAQELAYTAYALKPRIAIWRQIGEMGGLRAADAPAPSVDPHSFNKALADIEQLTANSSEGHAWRKYLLLDALRDWAVRRRNSDERMPRDLAQQVYTRLNRMSMTSPQRQFLTSKPVAALNREMIRSTAEAVESNRLLQHLENFEKSGLPSDARLLARDCQFLSVSSGAAQRELGERVETYFRNANLRVAVSAELLNRMMPKREPEYSPVQDTIQGAAVRGQSLTANEISVQMIPDPQHVLMALVVNGEVAAVTRSTSGPATFYTDSESSYLARKPLEITLRGIRMWPTEVSVDNNSKVRGVHTDFDRMPLFGQIARNMSLTAYGERRPAADAEVREKIAAKAKERVDREATDQVTAAAKRLHDEVLGPMDSLLLDPLMVSAETTDKRFSMRIRLAGPDQLGGHTPRPQAPADSLGSVQVHESLLNNVLERLELDGQTFDLAGLNRRLSERMHRFQPKPVDPDQEDVKIAFAAKDAVHVRCNDGRLEVTLAITRLSKGSRRFKDFQVRAFYKPVVAGRSINLVRDGNVQLIGSRMNAFAQMPIRSVFLKVFSDKQPIHMMPESFVKNPKLEGVEVTQFVIADGWIGAALGPQGRVAAQVAAQR
jgi:hypothetical protein